MEKNLTKTSTITSKYQTVIPSAIRKSMGLKRQTKLVWRVLRKGKIPFVVVSPQSKNWTEYLSGLGKDIWTGIKVDDYINSLRDQWSD